MENINFTKNNKPFEAWPGEYDPRAPIADRAINLDQFLYDLDEQICILGCRLNDEYNCACDEATRDYIIYLEGQINALETIRSQFDGF